MRSAAYWSEFYKAAILQGYARELDGIGIIEVLEPVHIPIRGKDKVKGVWKERTGIAEYSPGYVLHREWREAAEWEHEEWSALDEDQLYALGVYSQGGSHFIQIVEKVKAFPFIIRQRAWHIPSSEIGQNSEGFHIQGDAEILGWYCQKLTALIQVLVQPISRTNLLSFSQETFEMACQFETSKSLLKQKALKEITLAQESMSWQMVTHTSQATTYLLEKRARAYEIAVRELQFAKHLMEYELGIDRRFHHCYERLGKLAMQLQAILQSGSPDITQILRIAKEGLGIYRYLANNVPTFNPYYDRMQSDEFKRLSRCVIHYEKGNYYTVLNDLKIAASKLRVLAIYKRPIPAEVDQLISAYS